MQEAALQLAYGEYWQLSPQQRLTLLRCLVHLTLGVEVVRDHLQALVEAPVGVRANPLQVPLLPSALPLGGRETTLCGVVTSREPSIPCRERQVHQQLCVEPDTLSACLRTLP